MKQYLALCHIDRGTEQYNAGELVPLPDDTAERLLAMDPPAIARVAAPEAPAASVATPAKTPPAQRHTVPEMVARVKAAADLTALLLLQDEEHGHADGPRKTVVAAIEKRFDEFGAAEAAGDAADDADVEKTGDAD